MTAADIFLQHYGVRGMKWGVRKKRDEAARAKTFGPSKDSEEASKSLNKAKTSGLKSLSNQELRDLNNRLQLEMSYAKMVPKKKSVLDKGMAFTKQALGVGKTVNEAISFANSPAGSLLRDSLNTKALIPDE